MLKQLFVGHTCGQGILTLLPYYTLSYSNTTRYLYVLTTLVLYFYESLHSFRVTKNLSLSDVVVTGQIRCQVSNNYWSTMSGTIYL